MFVDGYRGTSGKNIGKKLERDSEEIKSYIADLLRCSNKTKQKKIRYKWAFEDRNKSVFHIQIRIFALKNALRWIILNICKTKHMFKEKYT